MADLDKYEHPEDDDDYRHRTLVNIGAFLFLILLVGGAVWLTSSIADMRKTQDCVLAGHRNCTPLDLGATQPPR